MTQEIYWDHHATTPCTPEVVDAMREFFKENFGNPSSIHIAGKRAKKAVEIARCQVAAALNCREHEIVFTSGATESNNIVFLGLLLAGPGSRNKIAVSSIEHKSVLEPARMLAKHGFELIILPVDRNGSVDLIETEKLIDEKTALVSVQVANNEIGTIQPVKNIAAIAHSKGSYFHTDAVQGLGKMVLDLEDIDCDFASFSAHKIYGPKGVGALFTRGGPARWPFERPLNGGGQEGELRPGTHNVPGIVGFGEACKQLQIGLKENIEQLKSASTTFVNLLKSHIPQATVHSHGGNFLPGIVSVSFPGLPNDLFLSNLPNYCVSRGSACNSGTLAGSHVLSQILDRETINNTVRFSFGRYFNESDYLAFFDCLKILLKKINGHERNF